MRRVSITTETTVSDVVIVYCRPCGYETRAKAAAAALQSQYGIKAELVPGAGGIFEVKVDDEIVVKRAKGYFPSREEIVAAVSAAVRKGKNK